MMTIAVPQFISLLSIGTLLKDSGALGVWYFETFGKRLGFGTDGSEQGVLIAKLVIVLVNVWVGIPYTILSTTGILLNIPKDLYESAKVDGAGTFTQFTKITMPYILFVTGPSLITNFIGNINNFNVIYLLSEGNPIKGTAGGASVGHTDLLITWLFKMTLGSTDSKYYAASIIGIMVFLVVAILSLIIYNVIPSTRNEEDYK